MPAAHGLLQRDNGRVQHGEPRRRHVHVQLREG
jgi:hypothetical protein